MCHGLKVLDKIDTAPHLAEMVNIIPCRDGANEVFIAVTMRKDATGGAMRDIQNAIALIVERARPKPAARGIDGYARPKSFHWGPSSITTATWRAIISGSHTALLARACGQRRADCLQQSHGAFFGDVRSIAENGPY
jgi:hypothetical protein